MGFAKCIIIMTTNAGAEPIRDNINNLQNQRTYKSLLRRSKYRTGFLKHEARNALGFLDKLEKDHRRTTSKKVGIQVRSAIKNVFRPEFLNRFTRIIIFNNLIKAEIDEVLDLMIKNALLIFKNEGYW